jgi:superfamily II DNA or RNA helicase
MKSKKDLVQAEATKAHLELGKRSIVGLSVGLGKTKLAIDRIKSIREHKPDAKVLFTGARQVYIDNFKKELRIWNCSEDNITMICNKSMLNHYEYFDLVIYDEAHKETDLFLYNIAKIIEHNKDVEILGLTGTPPHAENPIYKLLPLSYSYLLNDAVDNQFLNNFHITVVEFSMTLQEIDMYRYLHQNYIFSEYSGKYSPELSKLKIFLNNLQSKTKAVNHLINKFMKDDKLLIYAGSIEQGKDLPFPQYNSKMPKKEKEVNYNEFFSSPNGKLVNVGMLKESVSIPNLQYGFVMGIDSSPSSKIQTIGRFCRLNPNQKSHIYFFVAAATIEDKWFHNGMETYKDKIRYVRLDPQTLEVINQ